MRRKAFILKIKQGCRDEYFARHQKVSPELIQAIHKCGIINYTIFVQDQTVFGYMEAEEDAEMSFAALHHTQAAKKWREFMSDILIRDENMGFCFPEEAFHLESD